MFCKYCGEEILDEAVICPHCGVMVKKMDFSALQGQAQTQQGIDSGMDLKKTKLTRIFAVITAVLVAVSLMLLLSGIVEEIYFRVNMHSYNDGVRYSPFILPLFFGFVSLGTGVPTFIMGLKQQNAGVRLISIILFIASIFSFVTPFVCNMQ
jgi:hypothetical protein